MSTDDGLWVTEETYPGFRISHKVLEGRSVFVKRTRWQEIKLVDTVNFGKMLIIDGLIQSSEKDERYYHEAIVHPAMITHPKPRDVLILGGGEGASLREVLRHNTVKSVVMVEIDEEVVSLSKEHLLSMHDHSYNDQRVTLVIDDAIEYVRRCVNEGRRFDVIIQDLTDPYKDSPSVMLYTREYFKAVHEILNDDGIFVTQATLLHPSSRAFVIIHNTLMLTFKIVRGYVTYIPSYANLIGFIIGSKEYDPLSVSKEEIENRLNTRGIAKESLYAYDPDTHISYFILPKYIRKDIKSLNEISTRDRPVTFPL
ncbi:MAG: polyamine aminopropyltransferase [Candidatus Nitrosocaldus sp.]